MKSPKARNSLPDDAAMSSQSPVTTRVINLVTVFPYELPRFFPEATPYTYTPNSFQNR